MQRFIASQAHLSTWGKAT